MSELTEAQTIVLEKAKKEYDIKFKTWAIDRSIEIMKLLNYKGPDLYSSAEVLRISGFLCDWIMQTPKEWPVPTEDEAATMVEQMKADGEI